MLTLSRYNCALLSLNKKLLTVFGRHEDKFRLLKMRGLLKIKRKVEDEQKRKIFTNVEQKIDKLSKIVLNKTLNMKINAFYSIRYFRRK